MSFFLGEALNYSQLALLNKTKQRPPKLAAVEKISPLLILLIDFAKFRIAAFVLLQHFMMKN